MVRKNAEMSVDDVLEKLPRQSRRRLQATVRIPQILDAALAEFSTHGFALTRMDDIAAKAGLSKGGIYLHFRSKEHLLEALLHHFLDPLSMEDWENREGVVTPDLIVELFGRAYDKWTSGPAINAVRLLIAEGQRVSAIVSLWRRHLKEAINPAIQRLISAGVAQGTIRQGIIATQPDLLFSPVILAGMRHLIAASQPPDPKEQARDRANCQAMLRELLTP